MIELDPVKVRHPLVPVVLVRLHHPDFVFYPSLRLEWPSTRIDFYLPQIIVVSSSVFLLMITFQPLAKADIMKFGGRGSDSLNRTVYLSGVVISSTVLNRMLRGIKTPCGGLTIRSKVALTSAEVSSAPSCHSTPLRRKNV